MKDYDVPISTEEHFYELYDLNSLDGGISSAILIAKDPAFGNSHEFFFEKDIPKSGIIRLAELDFKDERKKGLKVIVFMKEIADAHQQIIYVKLPPKMVEPTIVSRNLRLVAKQINASYIDVQAAYFRDK